MKDSSERRVNDCPQIQEGKIVFRVFLSVHYTKSVAASVFLFGLGTCFFIVILYLTYVSTRSIFHVCPASYIACVIAYIGIRFYFACVRFYAYTLT